MFSSTVRARHTVRLILIPLLALAAGHALAWSPNNVLVISGQQLLEVSLETGQIVDVIEVAGGKVPDWWLPRGTVLLANAAIRELDANGNTLHEVQLPEPPSGGVVVGSNGHLYIGQPQAGLILEVDFDAGQIVDVIEVAGERVPDWFLPTGWLPTGQLLASGPTGLAVIDVNQHAVVREIPLSDINGVVLGPHGHLYIGGPNGLAVLDLETGQIVDVIEVAGEKEPDWFLPNERLLLHDVDGLVELDVATGTLHNRIALPGVQGVTVVGFRFSAHLKGRLTQAGVGIRKLEEVAIIGVLPGMRELSVSFPLQGDPLLGEKPSFSALATAFGTDTVVLSGFDAFEDSQTKNRALEAAQVAELMGSIAVQTKGHIGGDALFFVDEAKGTLHLGTPGVTFDGKLTSEALLP